MLAKRLGRCGRRSLLPALTIVFVLLALPGPGRLSDRANWRTPTVTRQFSDWSRTLSGLGFAFTPQQLEETSWRVMTRYLAVRGALVAPLEPLKATFGLGSAWAMFTTPQTDPGRLVIEAESEAGWQTLYASRSEEHTFLRPVLDNHRMRKVIGRLSRSEATAPRRALAEWLSREVAKALPEARRVRVSSLRWRTPAPHSEQELPAIASRGERAWSLVRPVEQRP